MANFSLKGYFDPTPKKIVKLADAITGACVFSGGLTSLNGHPIMGTIIFAAGFLAKIVSGFFVENDITNG